MSDRTAPNGSSAVLVCGAGIAGVQAALDLAELGARVYLADQDISIGGRMARLDKTFPTNDCATCILSPKLVEASRHPNITILTQARLEAVDGEAGRFVARLSVAPRYVLDTCTGCGDCATACPVQLTSEFNYGLGPRKAIYRNSPQAIPSIFAINKTGTSPCRLACPIGVNAQGYVALIAQRRFDEALALVREAMPFPSICGRVCTRPCEAQCERGTLDDPVAIRSLKRFLGDYERQHPREARAAAGPTRSEKVAVVGAGPSGLTAAYHLARFGYPVTIFEAGPVAGGMLTLGIPPYRLPKEIVASEIESIARLGVDIRTNTPVTRDQGLSWLRNQGFEAVFLGVGAQHAARLGVPGENLEGVLDQLLFLRQMNLGATPSVRGRVVVTGGGDSALDAARTALRLGASEVQIVYRRDREQMPADPQDVADAEEEGIKIQFLTQPVEILGRDDRVTGIKCMKMRLGDKDASGRRKPEPIQGSELSIDADMVVTAIGQAADLSFLCAADQLRLDRSLVTVDRETLETSVPGVFAGGDVVTGPATVVGAIAAGRRAALSINRLLRGLPLKPHPMTAPFLPAGHALRRAEQQRRQPMQVLPVAERIRHFREVPLGYDEDAAVAEASRCLSCGGCSECMLCVSACGAKAIDHAMTGRKMELDVGSIVLATGYAPFDAAAARELGHGRFPNVLAGPEFERMLSAAGPYGGHVVRPSDRGPVKRLAFIQCVGSRNLSHASYCSAVCCMYATKQAVVAKEHQPDLEATIFYTDMRAFGKGFYRYQERARDEHGVRFVRSQISTVKEQHPERQLVLRYGANGSAREEAFDLVVLASGLRPSPDVAELAGRIGVRLTSHGFCDPEPLHPVATSRLGIYGCGAFTGPKDIPESVIEGSAAAMGAARHLTLDRSNDGDRKQTLPEERDVRGEPPRVGVFVCRCGINIAGVVNVPDVVRYARTLPNVVVAEEHMFTCAPDAQAAMRERIKAEGLNRVVVAACTPRTHEPLFQGTVREAGLNPYLFEMANIRDQCSWVHQRNPQAATEKAKDLVRMSVGRARYLEPLHRTQVDVIQIAMVVGGGTSGVTAALALADQGIRVHLIEQSAELGGRMLHGGFAPDGRTIGEWRDRLIAQVREHPLIDVSTGSRPVTSTGCVGNFSTRIATPRGELLIRHGATILASGAVEAATDEQLFGRDPRVISQCELERQLASGDGSTAGLRSVVMIQCVGSRNPTRPYCSRTCCVQAVSNALRLRRLLPETNVFVLHRDLMTYGFHEDEYREAREAGVRFLRFNENCAPRVRSDGERLVVALDEADLRRPVEIEADQVVLSLATAPAPGNTELAKIFKVPLDADGFFLEAHLKLRPVDMASDGIYVCGQAHSPKSLGETIVQAEAAAARAATLLSKPHIASEAMVPVIDLERCIGCGVCETTCAYQAIKVVQTERGKRAQVRVAACKGCGSCSAACPERANTPGHFTDRQLLEQIEAFVDGAGTPSAVLQPRVLAMLCNWCAYAGADLAGVSRIQYAPHVRIIRTMCTGRIDPALVVEALLRGADGVMVLGCHPGDCHYAVGNIRAEQRLSHLRRVFEHLGLDSRRLKLDWVSAAEGARFAKLIDEFTEQVAALGPLRPRPRAASEVTSHG